MRFLFLFVNAYGIIFVTSLVKEPDKLRYHINRYHVNRYHVKLSALKAFCSIEAQYLSQVFISRVTRIFRKGKTQSDMFRHKDLLVFCIFRFMIYKRSTERMRRLICAFVVRIFSKLVFTCRGPTFIASHTHLVSRDSTKPVFGVFD